MSIYESLTVDLLIRLIFWFSLTNNDLNSSRTGNVSRETFNFSNGEYFLKFDLIKLYA